MADEQYTSYIAQMKRPIPGQSLSSDPDNLAPYERPPEFTNVHKAIEYLFINVIDEKTYVPILQAISDGTPIMELVQLILFDGFQRGKFNPDLMIMLAEPLAYMLIALAERADIDVVIYRDENEDEENEEEVFGVKFDEERINGLKKAAGRGEIPEGILPKKVVEEIQSLPQEPVESLLSAPVTNTSKKNQSLLSQQPVEQQV